MPIKEEFIDILSSEIVFGSNLMKLRELLVSFKVRGVSKNEMLLYLNELRLVSNEDVVLELMDFVEGYCNPQLSIY
ncbi:hypothetical protein H4F46_21270 [Pectobacterium brasiliense]|uniref:hypothetical protein n=1 Tax=Pectobacterium TaxID=122277 RepID=UPI00027E2A73|nr:MULTISPECIES: hypothetical protein [Pectobacterium]GKW00417.1 hypothetical protein PEC301653_34620 [Pectobacterium carotovorum subsp. carotovorum]AFR05548.1 hypothetical protein PCC21_041450 [Pectobacterium carotovorum subsp. carotovorum PCC21]KFF67398.1 hypothetical protein IW00_10600 [Pectobacterium brasiliense]MBA0211519.1 hypothetical protein [Pectobacterium brasiliense]MBN3117404.1 hypothetical protein [Pectobacterium brasiliense]